MKSSKSRRDFLVRMPLAMAGLVAVRKLGAQTTPPEAVPGATPAFNTGEGVGPMVTQGTFAEAEKLMQVGMSVAHREQAASSWRTAMAGTMERRVGPEENHSGSRAGAGHGVESRTARTCRRACA